MLNLAISKNQYLWQSDQAAKYRKGKPENIWRFRRIGLEWWSDPRAKSSGYVRNFNYLLYVLSK